MATVVLAQLRKPWRLPEVASTTAVAVIFWFYVRPILRERKDGPAETFKDTLRRLQTTFNWLCMQRACTDMFGLRFNLPNARHQLSHAARLDLFERLVPEAPLLYVATHLNRANWLAHYDVPVEEGINKYCNYPAERQTSVERVVLLSEGRQAWHIRMRMLEAAADTIDVV